jgi:hypothetical protein
MGLEFDGVNGIIKNTTSDGDVTIKGNDGGSEISALILDMSAEGGATFNNWLEIPDYIYHTADSNTYFGFNANDNFELFAGGTDRLSIVGSETVFNDGSADKDFRVESNGNTHALFVDAGNEQIGLLPAGATVGADVQIGFHDTATTATAMGTAHANDATLLIGGANSGTTQGSIYLGGQNVSADGVAGAIYGFSGGNQSSGIEFLEGSSDAHGQIKMSVAQGTGGTLVEALSINADLQTTIANHFNPPSSFRNLIINGNMSIAQRAATATGVANDANEGYNSLDRFGLYYFGNEGGVATMSRDTTVPSDTSYGVQKKSLKVDVTTADTSLGATGIIALKQTVEAQNIHHSGWDYTSSSSNITLSFWARSVKAGTYCVLFICHDASGQRYFVKEYTLVANTWKHVEMVVPGDSNLVFNADNGEGFEMRWILAAGDDRNDATADTWYAPGSAFENSTSNQVNFYDSTSNNFFLTGVQLEVGDKATKFEHIPHDIQMQRCQRYFESNYDYEEGDVFPAEDVNYGNLGATYQGHGYAADNMRYFVPFKVRKRGIPSITFYRIDGLGNGGTAGRWDFFDGSWQQMSSNTTVGEATETGVDVNMIDEDVEAMESFLIAGGWEADSDF